MRGKRKENWAELYRGFLYVKISIREIFSFFRDNTSALRVIYQALTEAVL